MKKILAIAIAALPAAAMADVEIYGKITAEIANNKTSSATAESRCNRVSTEVGSPYRYVFLHPV